jgi:hypothetical protein
MKIGARRSLVLALMIVLGDSLAIADPPFPVDPPPNLRGAVVKVVYWSSLMGTPNANGLAGCKNPDLEAKFPFYEGTLISLNDQGYVHLIVTNDQKSYRHVLVPTGDVLVIEGAD